MYNILICDDESDIRSALKIYLSRDGYRIFEAENGKQALETVAAEDIHLVLMDIMLLNAYIESVRWNFFSSLNLALVVPMTVLILIMTAFFICWTRIVYRHLGRRFFTWKTLGEVVLSLFLLQVPAIATCVYALLIY